jgi:hypothetical protein
LGFDIAPERIALLSARTQSIFLEETFPGGKECSEENMMYTLGGDENALKL